MRTTYKGQEIEIPEELQAAWVRQLRSLFDYFNYQYAASKLRRPLFLLGESQRKLGHWDGSSRAIMISAHHILENSWEEVADTLRHEMAHQYVEEVFLVRGAEPHGEAFRHACKILRCDPSATARPEALEALAESTSERDKILVRIKELLALAESPNEHEAANAMRMAQRYLMKYNLDLAEIDRERDYRTAYLGRSSPRVQEYEYALSLLLEEHFFVLAIWSHSYDAARDKTGRRLQVCGTPHNLEIAAYVYDYVQQVSESLWKEQKRELRRTRGPGKRGTKFQYLAGLVHGLHEKLDRQKQELVEERGLVWAGDRELEEYFRYINPRTRAISTSGVSRNQQFNAGREDGRNLNINRGISGETQRRGRQISGPE